MSVSDGPSALQATGTAVFLGLLGLGAGIALLLVSSIFLAAFVTVEQGSALTNAVAVVAQGAGLVAVGAVYVGFRDLEWSYVRFGWPSLRDLGWVVAATVALFAVLGGLTVIVEQLGLSATDHSTARAAEENPAILLPLIPLSVLVTGPAEEFLYRGVIQTRLKEAFDARLAVFVAASVFSVVHVPAYAAGSGLDSSLATTLGILFVLGIVLGAAYELADNLVVPIVAHGVYNAVVFGSLYVENVGGF